MAQRGIGMASNDIKNYKITVYAGLMVSRGYISIGCSMLVWNVRLLCRGRIRNSWKSPTRVHFLDRVAGGVCEGHSRMACVHRCHIQCR